MNTRIFAGIFITLTAITGFAIAQGSGVTIAMVPSLMGDLSKSERKVVDDEFPMLVKEFTGLGGSLVTAESVKDLAEKLKNGSAHFGVFQGIEFAEAQAMNPSLKPLLIAVYRSPTQSAVVVAKKDGEFAAFADLKGKDVAVLKQGKEHIQRYLAKETGGDATKFFGKITETGSSETMLNSVVAGRVQAAVVDRTTLELFREVSPGVYNRLKVIGESQPFPSSVIAYDSKKADPAAVKRLENGLLKANTSERGREFMSTFRITSFTPVPADFEKSLAAIRTAYPK